MNASSKVRSVENSGSETEFELSFRAGVCLAVILTALLLLVIAGQTTLAVLVAPLFVFVAAALVWQVNRTRPYARFITFFFFLAAAHAIFGYWAAVNSTAAIWIGSSAESMFRQSFLVISTTLLTAAFSYAIAIRFPARRAKQFCRSVRISEQKLIGNARILLIAGCVLVTIVVLGAGFMPMLTADPGVSRYFSPDVTNKYKQYEWTLYLGLDFLACSLPLVFFSAAMQRSVLDWLLGLAGIAGILVGLRRSYLLSAVAVLLLTIAFVRGRFPRRYALYLALLILGYFSSQLILLNALGGSYLDKGGTSAVLSGLPETRDLGWVMSLLKDRRLYGSTFVSIVPLLGRVSNVKSEYGLVEVTTQLIGLEGMAMTGGLRLTVGGEGFVNFGPPGCLIMGALFGALCAFLSHINEPLLSKKDLASSYLAASLFLWICFWFYLAGTEATGAVRNGLLLTVLMFYLSRARVLQGVSSAKEPGSR